VPLMQQWQSSIMQFLDIQEQLPEEGKSRGRKKIRHIVGQLGGTRKDVHDTVDIAVFQSAIAGHEVKDIVKNYGLVIVDECHHVAAASFQKVMDEVTAKYVYGLSATPVRQDGKQPIVYMQCGPVVYRDDARKQAEERRFEHLLSPRFTNYQIPPEWDLGQSQIQDIFTDLTISVSRNKQIIHDILTSLRNGRNIIVLTDRKDHVERLVQEIKPAFSEIIALTGTGTTKQKREKLDLIKEYPTNQPMLIIATGKYVGEGFDVPRLDTLFLVMPFSWKGTLAQYAGRLHRIYSGKSDVQIYDYVDIHVPVLERMYGKRLKGYRDLGYQLGEPGLAPARLNFIFDQSNYWDSLMNDLFDAKEMIWISSTSLNIKSVRSMEKTISRRNLNIKNQVLFINQKDQTNTGVKKDYTQIANEILERLSFIIRPATEMSCNAVIIDHRILWYGSLAPIGFSKENESIMRIESPKLAMDMQCVLTDKAIP
jgi:superfamily II DNA or RNA helicase